MSYSADYGYTAADDDTRARFSSDPQVKADWARIRALNSRCHEILRLAKQYDTEALERLLGSGEAGLATVYERFEFTAWLDPGGAFVAKNVTVFQAALLQPEEFGPLQSDGSISGIHTGKCFLTLLRLLVLEDKKSILLHQDATGKTVLHMAAFTGSNNSHIIQLIQDTLATEPGLQKELWKKKDKRGKTALAYARCEHDKRLLSAHKNDNAEDAITAVAEEAILEDKSGTCILL
ncbi:expressed unknown protein [Seminavis robusta]|uniref:Uncharacterized protein n=1 Tax=Seminavis robusta TaxID=568900 RepID=A0A9N8DQD1_9STRA|nr:expressed unknown protein [Seminavis robusta]|eukprot:Sro296_g110760.1 n/a (235) ;mRNA; f:67979-68683